ncbi:sulfite exporter TauE/SafE family protein [Sporolactobacillus laevolacticus]|uniref:sulfite exporter TauE/SafE family protein n=1 Tax=Sporolactobacillus laevolacticus TaxID=33018 RepID=UPI0025B2CB81|nr:TSUP family transporter [Sporolactobacillus laevolacticus]MDN3955666.1 TSUP family transporter [Sporolactobacillus laevolacticus]
MHTILTDFFLMAAGFCSGFIDAVVGGGGLISTPALLSIGLPPQIALGTNKLASSTGSLTSTLTFIRSGKINLRLTTKLFPLSFIGSACGVLLVHFLSPEVLRPLILFLLIAVTIYTIAKKDWGSTSLYSNLNMKTILWFFPLIFIIGFYDGFLGPGTGSFLIFSFLTIGFDFVRAAGNAKLLNFGSNIAGLLTFAALGYVNYRLGLIMAVALIVGSWCGAKFAIKHGSSYVKVFFVVITVLLIGKNVYSYFSR